LERIAAEACRTLPARLMCGMSVHEIAEAVMELSETDRLDLARRIVDSVVADQQSAVEVARAVQGIEDVLTGKVRGLNEAEFQRALG
jgi:hypothetical protein